MNQHKQNHSPAFRFHRFCRAAYAAFNSLHRVVNIGHLATYIADRQLHKSAAIAALGMLLLPLQATAQTDDNPDERLLPAVDIIIPADTLFGSPEPAAVLTAQDFSNTSVHSLGDLVAMLPGIDMRTRGGNDVQGDLSLRGGTFDQMVLLLNGVNFTDAQTGHHLLDIPIDIAMVQRIELLSPAQLMARGITAFCGGINIVVSEEYRDHLMAELSGGSHGFFKASLLGTKTLGPWAVTLAGAYNRSDGYMANTDYRHGSLFVQATRHAIRDDWHLQLGGQAKAFGSQAFYSTAYPDQYEATRTLTASAFNVHRWQKTRLETSLYGRLHRDRFELFRDGYATPPAWYSGHNHHLSSIGGFRSRLSHRAGIGEALLGMELRHEGIRSNVLGNPDNCLLPPYTHSAARLSSTLFGGYSVAYKHFNAEVLALGLYNTAFGLNYGFTASAAYRLARQLRLQASLCRTFRMPTFTDLYYQSVNQMANPDLNSEHCLAAELSLRYNSRPLVLQATLYYRDGHDIIDWIRHPDEEVWHAMNHTSVGATGADITFNYQSALPLHLSVGGGYSHCHIDRDPGQMISGYALEYLRHKANLYFAISPLPSLRLKADATYRYREGKYTDSEGHVLTYGGAMLLNAAAEYTLSLSGNRDKLHGSQLRIFVEGHNLLDTPYRDHGGVPQPGRTIVGGVRLSINPAQQ
jgi:iron complex outermembrane receptor protein